MPIKARHRGDMPSSTVVLLVAGANTAWSFSSGFENVEQDCIRELSGEHSRRLLLKRWSGS